MRKKLDNVGLNINIPRKTRERLDWLCDELNTKPGEIVGDLVDAFYIHILGKKGVAELKADLDMTPEARAAKYPEDAACQVNLQDPATVARLNRQAEAVLDKKQDRLRSMIPIGQKYADLIITADTQPAPWVPWVPEIPKKD